MTVTEKPFVFACEGEMLLGVLHEPARPIRRGVLIVVGGPQYRVGSHRQFLLIARALAAAGIPTMRFDYRGMGDSGGAYSGFERIDADIAAAIDAFVTRCTAVKEIFIWGLCDAASAALFYAYKDQRVSGLVLVNPWARTVAGSAKAYLKHYYVSRLFERAFWRKLLSGQFSATASIGSLIDLVKKARTRELKSGTSQASVAFVHDPSIPLPQRMGAGLRQFSGAVLLIICGNDLTAREFEDAASSSPLWHELLASPRVRHRRLNEADHTFSRREWRQQICEWTIETVAEGR